MIMVAGLAAGCSQPFVFQGKSNVQDGSAQPHPVARPNGTDPVAKRPPKMARTVEQFDTTSAEEKKAATAAALKAQKTGAGRNLGRTIASLGDPGEPGLWLKTPLVSKPSKGRVVYPATGKAVEVDLMPLDGPKTGGSRISLAALRVIEAPLTDLPEVDVYLQ
ncbi:hypothetical protein U5922_007455 [Aquicoccus sp. G2-2]|uniref:hypothetical protein n=1 Tax=Aquicoccus sp. G2-2 TaxID=3092120 RepID=UPI00366FE106